MLSARAAGVLLHLGSLPESWGPPLGPAALRFADWLAAAGQSWWQMLPVGPPGPGASPYSSPSSFAGDPGLLRGPGRRCAPAFAVAEDELAAFRRRNRDWLPDWCLYAAIKEARGGAPWWRWPAPLRQRSAADLKSARRELGPAVERHELEQMLFHLRWAELRAHCRDQGLRLLGDLPLFVELDSADVWAHRELFRLDAAGKPTVVTGVPPDLFSRSGQRWGHPHYRWAAHRREGFRWWLRRFQACLERFDAVRIDHFIGLHRVWEVPPRARTARRGRWGRTPGRELLEALRSKLRRELPLVAEDLGVMTPEVRRLRDDFGLPGMRVLQWAFWPGARADRPHAHTARTVVYTGTHDNDTTQGWLPALPADVRRRALAYTGGSPATIHRDLARAAFGSPAVLAVVPMQDHLGLGAGARMNRPGTADGNWTWRLSARQPSQALARDLRVLTKTF
ncbi:MAG: 4-alpha-glucanotransferase, partial [Planctomycetes bacterium]|nr:4-alpha-glucanotransferase [Planctomycetota bacterium]